MSRLIWAPAALADAQRHYRFLAAINPDAAQRAIKTIRDAVRVLARYPETGRPIEDMPEQYRDWVISFGASGYVARYCIISGVVLILAVRHQRELGFNG